MQQDSSMKPRWVNPYRALLSEHPGRIFRFDDFSEDKSLVREQAASAEVAYCEIGSGSGKHAIALAQREPQAKVFGFEVRYKRAVRTLEKATVAGVNNVFVLRTRGELLGEIFPPASLNGIYVNFPDPWEKPRRRKHRILSAELFELASSVLKPGGFLSVKTDHLEYFRSFLEQSSPNLWFTVTESTEHLHASPWAAQNLVTEFESLFLRQGLPICYVKLILKS